MSQHSFYIIYQSVIYSYVLFFLVAPSIPICKIQGKVEYGENINLTCLSEEGLPKSTYKWEGRGFRNMPRAPAPRTTDSKYTDTVSDRTVESGK